MRGTVAKRLYREALQENPAAPNIVYKQKKREYKSRTQSPKLKTSRRQQRLAV